MKRFLLLLLILILPLFAAFTLDAGTVYYATDDELKAMVKARNLPEGSRSEMQDSLYKHENLTEYTEKLDSGSEYALEIVSADILSYESDTIVLEGNVTLSFSLSGSSSKTLNASSVIVDTERRFLTALDNVSFQDSDNNASLPKIEADIVTVFWDSGSLSITQATTSSDRKNSEDKSVTFYTTGSQLSFSEDGGIIYKDGFIASNPKTAYSSISASNIAMMPGSDMFISDAVIRIGRVPILYLPFFFFPGSRPLGNPAFGFSSARGAFLNTTFEIFGSSSRIDGKNTSSSFTALLKGAQGENEYPTGPYYSEKEEESDIDKWARSSKSYMAIMADAYEKNGIHLGLDSALSFFDKKLKVSLFDGIALSPMTEGRTFRYYGENSLSFESDGLSVKASFPFYSDQRVLYDYANRLTVFSIDPILGNQPEFPSSFSSSKTSFTRSASLSYRLPSKLTNDLIKSLSISKAEVSTSYARKYVSNGIYRYIKEKTLLPSIELSLSGTIWSASYTAEEKKDTEEKDETEIHIIKDPLLYEIYKEKASSSTSAKETYSASLGYTFSESLENRIEYGTDEEKKLDRLYSKSTMKLLLNASMSSYFSLESSLTPSFQYIFEEDSSTGIATDTSSIISDVKMSVPAIGLSYRISSRLFSFVKSTSSETYYIPGWNKETITAHSLSLSKSIDTAIGRFTPSLSYAIPPLSQTLSPKLSYSFGNVSAAFSWKFKDDSTGFKPDLAELSLGYNGKYIVATAALKYQSALYTPSDFFNPLYGNASLTLRSADKSYSVMEYVEFENATNQFKSIKTTFRIPSFSLSLNWKGAYSDVRFREIAAKTDMKTKTVQFWKGRIYLAFSLSSSFYIDIENPYSASFSITPAIDFSIAEFLDFRFSFTSVNNNFGAYIDAGSGAFSFRSLFEDLLRSLDIFTGGNRNTNFVLNSLSLEAVHYMEDWDLHCKYSTEVVLSGYKYDFVPKFSVFLSWNTLPDLKVDQKWKKSTTGWVKE